MNAIEIKNDNSPLLLSANIFVQISSLLASQFFVSVIPLYIPFVLIWLVIILHTVAAAGLFAEPNIKKSESDRPQPNAKFHFLTVIAYYASCYQLFNSGFIVTGILGAGHVTITLLTIIFRVLKSYEGKRQ